MSKNKANRLSYDIQQLHQLNQPNVTRKNTE